MSTYWRLHCVDCDSAHEFQYSNHREEGVIELVSHAAALAAFAPAAQDLGLEGSLPIGTLAWGWFREHGTHRLVARSEWGQVLLGTPESYWCASCNKNVFDCSCRGDYFCPTCDSAGFKCDCLLKVLAPSAPAPPTDTSSDDVVELRDDRRRALRLAHQHTEDTQSCEEAVASLCKLLDRRAQVERILRKSLDEAQKANRLSMRERDEARAELAKLKYTPKKHLGIGATAYCGDVRTGDTYVDNPKEATCEQCLSAVDKRRR